jgi:AcrR family transcriptional regulator
MSGMQTLAKAARPTQAERSQRTQDRLVAAAIDALCRYGYAATSTSLVAELARVSRGAMVHQFPTKVDLMAAVARSTYAADVAAYRQALTKPMAARTRILTLFDTGWEQFSSPGGIAQTEIWMATRSDADLAAVIIPLHDQLTEQTRESFRILASKAGLVDADLSAATMTLHIASMRGLALEQALGTDPAVVARSLQILRRTTEALLGED